MGFGLDVRAAIVGGLAAELEARMSVKLAVKQEVFDDLKSARATGSTETGPSTLNSISLQST